jgi:mono/diheme cytochrome c family protein
MSKAIRFYLAVGIVVLIVSASGLAQSAGEATYKAKCQNCHGTDGQANSGIGKAMKVKPVTDPSIKQLDEATMIETVRNGEGKMQSYKSSLTDAQIKDAVDYLRKFMK